MFLRTSVITLILLFIAQEANPISLRSLVLDSFYKMKTTSDIPTKPAKTSIEVIALSYSRDGSESLSVALTNLGYKTYHNTDAISNWHIQSWINFFDGKKVVSDGENSKDMLFYIQNAGYTATVGFPAAVAYKPLLKKNPHARVILSVHPKGEKGLAVSTAKTVGRWEAILGHRPFSFMPRCKQYVEYLKKIRESTGGVRVKSAIEEEIEIANPNEANEEAVSKKNRENVVKIEKGYLAWLSEVKSHVEEENLLIHNPNDGYLKLCEYLEIEYCPETKYPFKGKSKDDLKATDMLEKMVLIWRSWWILIVGGLLFVGIEIVKFLVSIAKMAAMSDEADIVHALKKEL